jgi:diacylglycerol O-acyltransferase
VADRPALNRRMGNTDALMLRIERSALLRSTILQVALLDGPPDPARMRAKVVRGTAEIARFRQVPVPNLLPGVPPSWEAANDFDVDYHLRFARLSGSNDMRALLDQAALIAVQSFDPARPLWESHVINGLEGGQAAAIQKIHHALGDGVSLLDMILLFVDIERDPDGPLAGPDQLGIEHLSTASRIRDGLMTDALAAVQMARVAPGQLISFARDPVGHVRSLLATSRSAVRLGAPGSGALSPLMRGRSISARFDTLVVPLDQLRTAAKRVGGKLNTAFLAGVAGGLGRYHQHHGMPVDALNCAMPISTRGGSSGSLGNQFSPTRFRLPVSLTDTVQLLEMARDITQAQKAEPGLSLTDSVARAVNTLPAALVVPAFEHVMRGIDVVVSNVPGSPIPLYVAGARSIGNFGFAPRAGAAVNVTVISHIDELHIAINSDPAAIADPDVFAACLEESFDDIRKEA